MLRVHPAYNDEPALFGAQLPVSLFPGALSLSNRGCLFGLFGLIGQGVALAADLLTNEVLLKIVIVPVYALSLWRALLQLFGRMRAGGFCEVHLLLEEFIADLLLDCTHIVAQVIFVPVAAGLPSQGHEALELSLSRSCFILCWLDVLRLFCRAEGDLRPSGENIDVMYDGYFAFGVCECCNP